MGELATAEDEGGVEVAFSEWVFAIDKGLERLVEVSTPRIRRVRDDDVVAATENLEEVEPATGFGAEQMTTEVRLASSGAAMLPESLRYYG